MSEQWVDVGPASALKPGKSQTVTAHGYAVALYNVDGELFATQDHCPHEGVSLGSGGCLRGQTIACGYHHWEFDVSSGESLDGFDDALWVFPVKVEGGQVLIGLPEGLDTLE